MTQAKKTKERPILFSGEMVRAIIQGWKTQTRRLVKGCFCSRVLKTTTHKNCLPGCFHIDFIESEIVCPYGQPGDRLWVRETWRPFDPKGIYMGYIYRASEPENADEYKWKPSIHMPRAASRILLEVTDVRVERLQEISEADAMLEGVREDLSGDSLFDFWHYGGSGCWGEFNARGSFESLWESINGPGSWEQNPWVWVITFKKL